MSSPFCLRLELFCQEKVQFELCETQVLQDIPGLHLGTPSAGIHPLEVQQAAINHFPSTHPACWALVWCALPSPSNAETRQVLGACLHRTRTGRGIIGAPYPHSAQCFLLYRHIYCTLAHFTLDQQLQVHPSFLLLKARMKSNFSNSLGGSYTSRACSICAS